MLFTANTTRQAAARFGSSGVLRVFTLLLILAAFAHALAQSAPTLALGSASYVVGDTLELRATNLEPGAVYQVELTPPAEEGAQAQPLVYVLVAGQDGRLTYTSRLSDGGTYRVQVTGPRLDASLNVRVTGLEDATGELNESSSPGTIDDSPAPPESEGPADTEDLATEVPAATDGDEEDTEQPEDDAAAPGGVVSDEAATEDQADGATDSTSDDTTAGTTAQQPQTDHDDAATDADTDAATDEATGSTSVVGPTTEEQPDDTAATDATGPDGSVTGPTPADDIPDPVAPQPLPSGTTFRIVGQSVQAESATGAVQWRLDFPVGSGITQGLDYTADRLVVGNGNHLLELAHATGQVLVRHRLPAQVVDATITGTAIDATVQYSDGATRRVRVTDAGPTEQLAFDPDPALYGWLRQEANVANPATRIFQDPTNPWLYVAGVQSANPPLGEAEASAQLELALENSVTFYERAQIADALLGLVPPQRERANQAMDAALADFAARGYRAELLTDQDLQEAYGFPLARLYSALGRGNMDRAGFWADWLYRSVDGTNAEAREALREYSLYLQEGGQRDEASLWRTRANELRAPFNVGATISNAALMVGRTGWYGVAALVVSILALHLTLLAKYWRPQSLTMQRARNNGKNVSPVMARLSFMRNATFLEKLVVVLLFASALALSALHGWSTRIDAVPQAFGSGSLATPVALDSVVALDTERPDAVFVRGYAAQSVGDRAEAERAYSLIPDDAAALNNLAVLTGNTALFNRALEVSPNNQTVLYNLGQAENPSGMAAYTPDQPLLIAPDTVRVGGAMAGTYLEAWAGAFTNPWNALVDVPGITLPAWLWTIIVALFLLWALVSIIWLVTPRTRLARNAPRTFTYHLLALLLPGTGLADELWGLVLMVPWAIFGVDLLLFYLPNVATPVIGLQTDIIALIVIYVLNLVAFFFELRSYRRRMADLKRNDPQTAREYGMRVPTPELG